MSRREKCWVDHRITYIAQDERNAIAAYTQKRTSSPVCNHFPLLGTPYLANAISMTPQLTTLAGMKSDSEGSRKDCLNEPGLEQNRMVMRMQQVMKRTMVRMRKMLPMVFRPLNLNGIELIAFAIPPVAITIVNQFQVKFCKRSFQVTFAMLFPSFTLTAPDSSLLSFLSSSFGGEPVS